MTSIKFLLLGFDALDHELWHHYGHKHLDPDLIGSLSPTAVKITPEIYETGPSWTSIMTGQKSSSHGMRDGWGRSVTQAGKPSRSFTHIPGPYLWERLNQAGLRCGVVNVPVTWPPKPIDGFMVSGFPCPLRNITYPKTLEAVLGPEYIPDIAMWKNNLWDHNVIGSWRDSVKAIGLQNILEVVEQVDGSKIELLDKLIADSAPIEALVCQFAFVDRIGHVFGMNNEEASVVYPYVAGLINRLLKKFAPAKWCVVSDHGMKGTEIPNKKSNHTYNALFMTNAEVTLREGANFDILPTILELLHIPADARIDGQSLIIHA